MPVITRVSRRRCAAVPPSSSPCCAAWIDPPSAGAPSVERGERSIEVRSSVAEHEPVVAQLRDLGEVESVRENRVAFLERFLDLRAHGVGNERGAVEAEVEPLGVLQRALEAVAVGGDQWGQIRGCMSLLSALPVLA